jgi:hypothetical protein
MTGNTLRGAVWVAVYLLFILAPLFALLAGSLPATRDFWTEFAVAIGYSGLAMMGLQFGLTARFRYVTEPWGEDNGSHPSTFANVRFRTPAAKHLPVVPRRKTRQPIPRALWGELHVGYPHVAKS